MKWVFVLILAVRVFNALTIRTFFQLDEYYQALEPLYHLVFGNGMLTWEWHNQLRSFIHPLMFALVYKICQFCELEDYWVRSLPKILQLVLSSIGEYFIFAVLLKLTHQYKVALISVLLSLTSPFNWYFITRTFSNNFEMILTVVALNYFPMRQSINWKNYTLSISLALISCIIRPTNGFIWLCLGVDLLIRTNSRLKVLLMTTLITLTVMSLNIFIDYSFYHKLTFPIWNFLQFNVLSSLSSFYGINSLSFYIVQGIPVIMTTYLPFLIVGSYQVLRSRNVLLKKLFFISIGNVILFSVVSHKEFRFIYPLMPFFMIFSAFGYIEISKIFKKKWNTVLPILLLLNFAISYYMVQVHESGVIEVVDFLKNEVSLNSSIGFFTPCHSTPYQSYFNFDTDIDIWSLSCEPPLQGQDLNTYMDESDIFYAEPVKFLQDFERNWPEYIVIFDALPEDAKLYLGKEQNYKELTRIFNSRAHWDDRRNGDVIVLTRG